MGYRNVVLEPPTLSRTHRKFQGVRQDHPPIQTLCDDVPEMRRETEIPVENLRLNTCNLVYSVFDTEGILRDV